MMFALGDDTGADLGAIINALDDLDVDVLEVENIECRAGHRAEAELWLRWDAGDPAAHDGGED